MPSKRQAIQDAIKQRLDSVSGVENVYVEDVRAEDVPTLIQKARTQDGNHIQWWVIHRLGSEPQTAETHPGRIVPGVQIWWNHRFELQMFVGRQSNVSEAYVQDLVDSVLDSFKNQRTLGGWNTQRPLSCITIQDHIWGDMSGRKAFFTIEILELEEGISPE